MNWQVSSFKLDPWNTAKERLVISALNIIFKNTFCSKGRRKLDILNAPIWSDTCLLVSWKRSFESYIHKFHLNYAAIFYYCPRFCVMKIFVTKSSTVFQDCKNCKRKKWKRNTSKSDSDGTLKTVFLNVAVYFWK